MSEPMAALLAAAAADPELAARLRAASSPASVVEIAAGLGIAVAESELVEYVRRELSDADLAEASGGMSGLSPGYVGLAQSQSILFANMVNQQGQYAAPTIE